MDEKLLADVTRGNMAEICLRELLKPYIENEKSSLMMNVINCFREGKHGSELLAGIGEIAALDRIEKDFQMTIIRGQRAAKHMEDKKNDR